MINCTLSKVELFPLRKILLRDTKVYSLGKKIFANHVSDKDLKIDNEKNRKNSTVKNRTTQLENAQGTDIYSSSCFGLWDLGS